MSDPTPQTESRSDEAPAKGGWSALKKVFSRLSDWFVVQAPSIRILVIALTVLIPASAGYSLVMWHKQVRLAQEVRQMAGQNGAERLWSLNENLPVVFGTGSLLGFLERHPVDRITVIYRPLLWNVSERFVLVESEGRQHAYYPSDLETKIFSDRAVTAAWAGQLVFVPREELGASSVAMVERLDQRFAGARPHAEKEGWKAGVSGVPHFKIDGGGPGRELSGGQPPEAFLRILRSLPKTTPIASVGGSAGGSASLASTVLGFRVGGTVAIQGVLAKPELNGQTGTVLGAQGAERVQVRLASGVEMALKPTNLAESSESGL